MKTKIFGWLFLSTGIFSIVSSLFAWGEGWLFSLANFNSFSFILPMVDLLTTAPCSIISAYGILKYKTWGISWGILTAGMYIFGSVLVWIQIITKGLPYNPALIIPSVSGFAIASCYFYTAFFLRDKR